jgi:hypothetical protein
MVVVEINGADGRVVLGEFVCPDTGRRSDRSARTYLTKFKIKFEIEKDT